MNTIRLERLFNYNEHAVIIAAYHGEFDGPISGMIKLPETVFCIDPSVDGILLSPGMLTHCGRAFNFNGSPMAIVRLNWSTVYCFQWGYREAETVPACRPKEALRLGADAVLVSLTLETGSEARDARNVEVFCDLCGEAKDFGLPVIGEYYPPEPEKLSPEELYRKVYVAAPEKIS